MVEINLRSTAETDALDQLRSAFDLEVSQDRLRIAHFSEAVAMRNVLSGSSVAGRLHKAIRDQVAMRASVDLGVAMERALLTGR